MSMGMGFSQWEWEFPGNPMGMGIILQLGNGYWKGVGINKYGNGNDPIPIGKYSPRFFYCCRLALG